MGFSFKQFHIEQEHCAMKVGTDGVLIGAWARGGKDILDIGTGTGLIALMMAQRFPLAKIVGIDIDESAVSDAIYNINKSPFKDRVSIELSALQQYSKTQTHRFDAIVCNPPYFINSLKAPSESRTTARHTVSLSHAELIHSAKKLLKDEGTLSIIIPVESTASVKAEAILSGLRLESIVTLFTTPNATQPKRSLLCFRKTQKHTACEELSVVLNEIDGKRTVWYQELTANFYIK